MLKSQKINYHDQDVLLEGYYSYKESDAGTLLPAVLVCHDWTGKNEFACRKADQLAELGHVGFALDMYGNGKLGRTKEEKSALIQPFMQNRSALLQRILAALTTVRTLPMVDKQRIAIIGFCFGGLCALDLARSGAPIQATVSFHGLLQAPPQQTEAPIMSKILVLHGYDDPMVPPEHVLAFANEMTARQADWQLDIYGQTMHAFTNPEANDPGFGTVYNKNTADRSWIAMQTFFRETL